MNVNRVPWIEEHELRRRARKFREDHGVSTVPVPIERIAEFDYDLYIALSDGLFKRTGISGYLTCDCETLVIDRYCYENMRPTCRYTIAHELSHIELHREFWASLMVSEPSEYIDAMESAMSKEEYERLEWQASGFAGLVLVPPEMLAEEFEPQAEWARGVVSDQVPAGFDRQKVFNLALTKIAERLSPVFGVHPLTVGIRLVGDNHARDLAIKLFGSCHGLEIRYPNPA